MVAGRSPVGSAEEPLYLHALDGDYRGGLPAFYDPTTIPAAGILERNADAVRGEVLGLLSTRSDAFRTTFTPGDYRDARWRTLNLCTDGLRYHANRRLLPLTTALCESLPGVTTYLVGVLEPGCELRAHHGDNNALYRLHLGLDVPSGLPDVGIEVAGQQRGWEVGGVLAFEDAHLHRVWNRSPRPRTVLVVDVVKEELFDHQGWLRARSGAGILLQVAQNRWPRLAGLPRSARLGALVAAAALVRLGLPIQHALGPTTGALVARSPATGLRAPS